MLCFDDLSIGWLKFGQSLAVEMARARGHVLQIETNYVFIGLLSDFGGNESKLETQHTYELIEDMVSWARLEDKNHLSKRLTEATERLAPGMAYFQWP